MFKAIQRRRAFKRQMKQDTEDFYLNIGIDPDEELFIIPAPTMQTLQAKGLTPAAAGAYRFMWDYLNSQEIQADMEKAIDGRQPSYTQAKKRLDMMPGFMWQIKAVMDAIEERRIPDPDPDIVKKEIPRLIRQAFGGSEADFFQAENYLINIASGQSCF